MSSTDAVASEPLADTDLSPSPGAEIIPLRRRAVTPLSSKIKYAESLANSGLLPANYRRAPANVLFAIEYGEMLGLAPMAAMIGVHVIEGKPTASAALMSALVRAAGHKIRVRYVKGATPADDYATAQLIRSDDPDWTFESTWTYRRAVQAELCQWENGKVYHRTSNNKVGNWQKFGPSMLKARAISEVCRDGAEECLLGLHYTPEEIDPEREIDEEGVPVPIEDLDLESQLRLAGRDPELLRGVWERHPHATDRARIAQVAAEVGVPPKPRPPSEQKTAQEPLDVQEVATPSGHGGAAEVFDRLMVADTEEAINELSEIVRRDSKLGRTEVSSLLSNDEAAVLRLHKRRGVHNRLTDVAAAVSRYVLGHRDGDNVVIGSGLSVASGVAERLAEGDDPAAENTEGGENR